MGVPFVSLRLPSDKLRNPVPAFFFFTCISVCLTHVNVDPERVVKVCRQGQVQGHGWEQEKSVVFTMACWVKTACPWWGMGKPHVWAKM